MKKIRLPEELEKIGGHCFSFSGLKEIVLPANVKEVGAYAFDNCKQLESVWLNENLDALSLAKVADDQTCSE